MSDGAGDLRDEAERLVSAALAAASFAVRGAGRTILDTRHVSTGSDECCVCPVCRGIAAVRNPSPQLVFTMAKGATEVAGGIASVLRTVSAAVPRPAPTPRDPGVTWRTATRAADVPPTAPPADPPTRQDDDPWSAATRAAED